MEARYALQLIALWLLPVAVAVFDLSIPATLGLLLLLLAWRWLLAFIDLMRREGDSEFVLDAIAASHFVERVRWCMDRLGVDYRERDSAGILGVLFGGRTVPRLRFRAGRARSSIGNSTEILRYLWGVSAAKDPERAGFLEPTPERIELEHKLCRYATDLQVWIYYHLLEDKDLTLRLWGVSSPVVPWWQRKLLPVLYPVLAAFLRKSFRIEERHYHKVVERIENVLADAEKRLTGGAPSLTGSAAPDFVDLSFAALSGPWLQPEGYGGGRAEACRLARSRIPTRMRHDVERWIERYPAATAFIERLYREERFPGTEADEAGQTSETVPEADQGKP